MFSKLNAADRDMFFSDKKAQTLQISTSVIIPFFNNMSTLTKTVDSLLKCEPAPDEIILVDDGSTDHSHSAVETLPVKLIRCEHLGRATALNRGISQAKGELLLFTDADCIVPVDWVEKILDKLNPEEFSGIGGNLMPSHFTPVETAKVLRYVHEFETDYILSGNYSRFCLNGNNMAILKKAVVSVGGFDETFFHGADADLTRRLLNKGHKLLRTTTITTTHLKVDTFKSFLLTSFKRGSTIRFSKEDGSYNAQKILRSFFLSPLKYFIKDISSINRLVVFQKDKIWWPMGIFASVINIFGALFNAAGRVFYSRTAPLRKGD